MLPQGVKTHEVRFGYPCKPDPNLTRLLCHYHTRFRTVLPWTANLSLNLHTLTEPLDCFTL